MNTTYEYPLGVTFRASTPEHAAARVFGGLPADYLATRQVGRLYPYIEVMRVRDGAFMGDIPIREETRKGFTLGTVLNSADASGTDTLPARRHIGDQIIQVATGGGRWRMATGIEASTFTPLPVAQMPV